jgi:hypothetical protein
MLEHIFPALGVQIHTVILVRLGGFAMEWQGLHHHSQQLCYLLTQYAQVTETELPTYVLSDREALGWGNPEPYLLTDIGLPWMVNKEHVRVFRPGDGFRGCAMPAPRAAIMRPGVLMLLPSGCQHLEAGYAYLGRQVLEDT